MRDGKTSDGAPPTFRFDVPRIAVRVVIVCVVAELLFVLSDYVFNFIEYAPDRAIRRLFNPAREGSIPSWFSSTQFIAAGVVCAMAALVTRARKLSRWTWMGWGAVAGFFVFMGIDDAAMIHERVGSAVGRIMERREDADVGVVGALNDVPTYAWQVFVAPFFALAGLAMTVFLWKRLRAFGLFSFAFLGMACFATAVSMDFVEGMEGVFEGLADRWDLEEYTVSHYSKVIEETLEMLGTTAFLFAFLRYTGEVAAGVQFGVGEPVLTPEPDSHLDMDETQDTDWGQVARELDRVTEREPAQSSNRSRG